MGESAVTDPTKPTEDLAVIPGPIRALWILAGLGAVAIGGIGIIVPGLPTTGFMVFAAWCFSKSSPRLERWLLGLPGIGPLITDYRNGLGMPKRAKITAIVMITIACTISAVIVDKDWVRVVIIVAGLIGVYWVSLRVPTRPDNSASDSAAVK